MRTGGILKICALFILISAIMPYTAKAENFQYSSHGKRDPFVPLVGMEKSAVIKLEDVASVDDVHIEGILVGPKGIRSVVLNGEILKQGSKVGTVEVQTINKKSVKILIDGKEYTLKLFEEGGVKGE